MKWLQQVVDVSNRQQTQVQVLTVISPAHVSPEQCVREPTLRGEKDDTLPTASPQDGIKSDSGQVTDVLLGSHRFVETKEDSCRFPRLTHFKH